MSKQLERIHIMKKLLDRIEEEIHDQMNQTPKQIEKETSEFTEMSNDRELAIYKAIIAAGLLEDTIARA